MPPALIFGGSSVKSFPTKERKMLSPFSLSWAGVWVAASGAKATEAASEAAWSLDFWRAMKPYSSVAVTRPTSGTTASPNIMATLPRSSRGS